MGQSLIFFATGWQTRLPPFFQKFGVLQPKIDISLKWSENFKNGTKTPQKM